MYKHPIIIELSRRLEAGEISALDCLKELEQIRHERFVLKERCDAILQIEYEEKAKQRRNTFDKDTIRNDALLQLTDAWRNSRPLTNEKVIENIRYTKAFEQGLIDEVKLNQINVHTDTFTEVIRQFKAMVK